jgi:hypothetical protein
VFLLSFFALVYLRLEDLDCLAAAFSPEVRSLHRLGTRLMFSLYLDVKDMRFSLVRAFVFCFLLEWNYSCLVSFMFETS